MIVRIWRALVQSIAVAKCIEACRDGDAESAIKYYSQFEESGIARHFALGGRISLMKSDVEGARRFFEKAVCAASRKKNKRDRYVLEYCSFYLSLMDRDGMHERHRDAALDLKPLKTLFNMLPLAPKDWEQRQGTSDKKPTPKFKYATSKPDYSMDGSIDFNSDDN